MAYDLQANRLRRRLRRGGPVADINVAPFVDVLLVLVVIFMVAAPLLTTRNTAMPIFTMWITSEM